MKLFQYWDTGEPPDEVKVCIRTVRDLNPEFEYELFDRGAAAWFIGKRLGERNRKVFSTLAVPAMQADYFRLCALFAKGGVYMDADSDSERPLRELLVEAPHALMMIHGTDLQPGLMMFRERGDPLLAAWIEVMTFNLERWASGSAGQLTGPVALTALYSAAMKGDLGAVSASARGLTTVTWHDAGPWVGLVEMAYKRGDRHWLNWSGPTYIRDAP